MYGVGGERWLPELTVPWLPGYENSSPVRVGNDAYEQLQIAVFGEIADAMFQALKAGMEPPERGRILRPVVLEYLAAAWREPDEGIWEVRGGPQHFVHSKVMAWVTFDRRTLRAIEERLLIDGDFVLRYETDDAADGLPAGEGAFLACSFWLVDNYILQGRHAEARKLFDRLLSRCNDVGLLAEELDPLTGRMLGNFPQAYSHVGLINSALNLSREIGPAEKRAKPRFAGSCPGYRTHIDTGGRACRRTAAIGQSLDLQSVSRLLRPCAWNRL
jgi:GH15 family glucan-1,4-alpha-glucosidase